MTAAFRIGAWEVDPLAFELIQGAARVKISPRTMDVLVRLAERPGDVVTNEELLAAFWRGPISSTNAVHKAVAELRNVFGDRRDEASYIETVTKKGYRLVATVAHIESAAVPPADATPPINGGTVPIPASVPSAAPSRFSQRVAAFAFAAISAVAVSAIVFFSSEAGRTSTDRQRALTVANAPKTLAVLPFRSIGDNPDQAYLGEGIAISLLTNLSHVPNLTVINQERAFQHSTARESMQQIGAALGVDYVLSGTVQRADDHLRLTATMHETRSGEEVYGYAHDEPIDQIFAIQDKVAAAVLSELEVHLDDARLADMRDWGTQNVQAYLLALEGATMRLRQDQRSNRYGQMRVREAIALDPHFWRAYDLLCDLMGALGEMDAPSRKALHEEASALYQTVARLDPASTLLPDLRFLETRLSVRSPREYEREVRQLIVDGGVQGRGQGAYAFYADLLLSGHLFRESEQFLDAALAANPQEPFVQRRREGHALMIKGPRYAIPIQKETLVTYPNSLFTLHGLVVELASVGDFTEAEKYRSRLREIDDSGRWAYSAQLGLGVIRGDLKKGSAELEAALDNPLASEFRKGTTYLMVGDVDAGVAALRRMGPEYAELAGIYLVYGESVYPAWVTSDPRYQQFLDEYGIGRKWTAYLREKVAELAPITGIEPSDPTPQLVVAAR